MPVIDPSTGTVLTPSYHGKQCQGNGDHPGIECCCDECDYYLICFPEYGSPNRESIQRRSKMVNKVTLDFENNMVIWDTPTQKGSEFCPGLAERENAILAAMGYKKYDLTFVVDAVNDHVNGGISITELKEILEREAEG